MGYRSDIVIGMSKELYTKCMLLNNIPEALNNEQTAIINGTVYWRINDWKWYDDYPEVRSIQDWFNWCTDEEVNPRTEPTEAGNYPSAHFGALRSGEDVGDFDEWGEPSDFDIYRLSDIDAPI